MWIIVLSIFGDINKLYIVEEIYWLEFKFKYVVMPLVLLSPIEGAAYHDETNVEIAVLSRF